MKNAIFLPLGLLGMTTALARADWVSDKMLIAPFNQTLKGDDPAVTQQIARGANVNVWLRGDGAPRHALSATPPRLREAFAQWAQNSELNGSRVSGRTFVLWPRPSDAEVLSRARALASEEVVAPFNLNRVSTTLMPAPGNDWRLKMQREARIYNALVEWLHTDQKWDGTTELNVAFSGAPALIQNAVFLDVGTTFLPTPDDQRLWLRDETWKHMVLARPYFQTSSPDQSVHLRVEVRQSGLLKAEVGEGAFPVFSTVSIASMSGPTLSWTREEREAKYRDEPRANFSAEAIKVRDVEANRADDALDARALLAPFNTMSEVRDLPPLPAMTVQTLRLLGDHQTVGALARQIEEQSGLKLQVPAELAAQKATIASEKISVEDALRALALLSTSRWQSVPAGLELTPLSAMRRALVESEEVGPVFDPQWLQKKLRRFLPLATEVFNATDFSVPNSTSDPRSNGVSVPFSSLPAELQARVRATVEQELAHNFLQRRAGATSKLVALLSPDLRLHVLPAPALSATEGRVRPGTVIPVRKRGPRLFLEAPDGTQITELSDGIGEITRR